MKLYADRPARRSRQVVADVCMLCWVLLWAWAGRAVYEATLTLAAPGRTLEGAGGSFRDRMVGAGERVDDLPILADRLAGPFRDVSVVGTEIAAAGSSLVAAAERLALLAGLMTVVMPVGIVGAIWLVLRLRWVRRAAATARYLEAGAGPDLLALRALTHRPLADLQVLAENPAAAWRLGDQATIAALAELELREVGLAPVSRVSA